jgi:general secretion pathway protein F/type IV pilus assembly protein PilC
MYGQLSDLLRAGVPVLRSLDTVSKATPHARLSGTVAAVRESVAGGKTLAEAMREHPGVFGELHAAMVHAGETAGFLEDVLANLSDFLERQDEMQSKIRGALIYPAVLATGGVAVVLGILIFLVPQFKPFFEGVPLPGPTAILFAVSDLLVNRVYVVPSLLALAVLGVAVGLRSESGRRAWERLKLRVPVVGAAVRMVAITRFCRIFGTMLANGVPILQALDISKDATGSRLLSQSIQRAIENVRAGEPLATPLRASGLFPRETIEIIAVAEESNQLERVLVEMADTIERRTNRQVDQAVRLLEPLILVLMAAAIGFVAVGLLYPIFTMARTMR